MSVLGQTRSFNIAGGMTAFPAKADLRHYRLPGMNALSRMMGFLILCIGIQFVVNGILGIATDPDLIHQIRDAVRRP